MRCLLIVHSRCASGCWLSLLAEWVQGDQYGALLTADQVHTWPEGETEPYHLSGTPDAVVILTAYKDMGLPWEGIRLTVEVKKTVEMK